MKRTLVAGIVSGALTVGFVDNLAQRASAQASKPTFEVASIRAQTRAFTIADLRTAGARVRPGGVFNPTHATVSSLIVFAYELKGFQIVGGPDWIRRDQFEINARAGGDVPANQVRLMVQSLLEDRFKLVAHTERRDMRFLALVLARTDGRLGPYVRSHGEACTPQDADAAIKQFPPRTGPTNSVASGRCADFSAMVDGLASQVQMPAFDKTGLSGKFTYEMRYQSSEVPTAGEPRAVSSAFTDALEEQLGLKLRSDRGPIDVLVVDSVQQPTEN